MDLNSFQVFLTVVEEMSFTRAADKLFITQQALSASIKRLEDAYQVQLFQRRPTLRMTPSGEAMASYARQLLDTEQAMKSHFADMTDMTAGILRVGIPPQRLDVFFPDIWSSFHSAHPNISVRFSTLPTENMLEHVVQNELDITLAPNVAPTANLTLRPLSEEGSLFLLHERLLREYFPNDWKERLTRWEAEGVDPQELRHLPFLLPPRQSNMRRNFNLRMHRKHYTPNVAAESPTQNLIAKLGCYGTGAALITPLTAYQIIGQAGRLPEHCHIVSAQGMPIIKWYAAYRSDIRQPRFVLDMADAIAEEFSYYRRVLEKYHLQPRPSFWKEDGAADSSPSGTESS